MEHKQFCKRLSERTGITAADTEALAEALAMVMHNAFGDADSVAVPTFGTFTPVKHEEEISSDLSTGRRMLLPPEIRLEFTPAATLLRHVNDIDRIIR